MTNLIISTIAAAWIIAIAVISIQNPSLVSLKFLVWRSIDLPWGFVLAAAVGAGLLLGGWFSFVAGTYKSSDRR